MSPVPLKEAVSGEFDTTVDKTVMWAVIGLSGLLFLSAGFYNRNLGLEGPGGLKANVTGTAAAAAHAQLSLELGQRWDEQQIRDPIQRFDSARIAHSELDRELGPQVVPPVVVAAPRRRRRGILRGRRDPELYALQSGIQYGLQYGLEPGFTPEEPPDISRIAERAIDEVQSSSDDQRDFVGPLRVQPRTRICNRFAWKAH